MGYYKEALHAAPPSFIPLPREGILNWRSTEY
jgi:hypothetical protein